MNNKLRPFGLCTERACGFFFNGSEQQTFAQITAFRAGGVPGSLRAPPPPLAFSRQRFFYIAAHPSIPRAAARGGSGALPPARGRRVSAPGTASVPTPRPRDRGPPRRVSVSRASGRGPLYGGWSACHSQRFRAPLVTIAGGSHRGHAAARPLPALARAGPGSDITASPRH